ncbi:MAG: Carbamoyltransferase, partial [uncultured Blastococcus sp.]
AAGPPRLRGQPRTDERRQGPGAVPPRGADGAAGAGAGDLQPRPDPLALHALRARRGPRVARPHPDRHPRRRDRADPDDRCGHRTAGPPHDRGVRAPDRHPGRGEHQPQHRRPPDGRRPAGRAGVLRLGTGRPAGDRAVRGPPEASDAPV